MFMIWYIVMQYVMIWYVYDEMLCQKLECYVMSPKLCVYNMIWITWNPDKCYKV